MSPGKGSTALYTMVQRGFLVHVAFSVLSTTGEDYRHEYFYLTYIKCTKIIGSSCFNKGIRGSISVFLNSLPIKNKFVSNDDNRIGLFR